MNTIWVAAWQVGQTIQVKGFGSEDAARKHIKKQPNVGPWTIQEMRVHGVAKANS